jgi:hypothetical protein
MKAHLPLSYAHLRRVVMAAGVALLQSGAPVSAQVGAPTDARDAVLPISAALCTEMKAHRVLNPGAPLGCDRLRLVTFGYVGFDGQPRSDGELVVMDAVADYVLRIFAQLRGLRFPIASAKQMNHYEGDDDASMAANNTSALNVRPVAGSRTISLHAYGVAIDLNPIQNPYVTRSGRTASAEPAAGRDYLARKPARPGMAETVVQVFAEQGFAEWGGAWNNPVDYQHFQVPRRLAVQLARLPAGEARALFARYVDKVRACLRAARDGAARRACAAAA